MVTQTLAKLRSDVDLSQKKVGKYFGVDRGTVADWESGKRKPHKSRRKEFILYLWDMLRLRTSAMQFRHIWSALMVEQWGWEQLTLDEIGGLTDVAPTLQTVDRTYQPPHMEPIRPKHKLMGRRGLLEALTQMVKIESRISLYGLPGVGKTAICIELANDVDIQNQFPDGILWARLGRESDNRHELIRWAESLGVDATRIAQLPSLASLHAIIHSIIGQKKMLLFIDDAWEYQDALMFEVGGANCVHILTSRFPAIASSFGGNSAIRVEELSETDGLDLLASLTPTAVQAEPVRAKELVQRVGGLPLALVLFGNYLRTEALSKQLRRIGVALERLMNTVERMQLAEASPLGSPISLDTAIRISDEALSQRANTALRALSILPAKPHTFSHEAAAAVSGQPEQAIDELFDRGLLEIARPGRYMIHTAITDYARLRLSDPDVFHRTVGYFVEFAQTHEADHAQIDLEFECINSALNIAFEIQEWYSLIAGALAISGFLDTRGSYQDALDHLARAGDAARRLGDMTGLAHVLLRAGTMESVLGNYQSARELLLESIGIACELKNELLQCRIGQILGTVTQNLGDYDKALEYYRVSLNMAERLGDRLIVTDLLRITAKLHDLRGNSEVAQKLYRQALESAGAVKDARLICSLNIDVGVFYYDHGDYDAAEEYYRTGLKIAEEIDFNREEIRALRLLGSIAGQQGHFDQERRYYMEGLFLARAAGDAENILFILNNWAALDIDLKDFQSADTHLSGVLQLAIALGHQERIAATYETLGILEDTREDLHKAETYLRQGLEIAIQVGHVRRISSSRNALGFLHLKQQRYDLAELDFKQGLQVAKDSVLREQVATAQYGLAQIAAHRRQYREARHLATASYQVFSELEFEQTREVLEFLTGLPETED